MVLAERETVHILWDIGSLRLDSKYAAGKVANTLRTKIMEVDAAMLNSPGSNTLLHPFQAAAHCHICCPLRVN